MRFITEIVDGVRVMKIDASNLDMSTYSALTMDFESVVRDDKPIVLDIGEVTFIDSAGFGALMIWRRKARAQGSELVLCSLADRVKRTFKEMRLDLLFSAYPDRASALVAARNLRAPEKKPDSE